MLNHSINDRYEEFKEYDYMTVESIIESWFSDSKTTEVCTLYILFLDDKCLLEPLKEKFDKTVVVDEFGLNTTVFEKDFKRVDKSLTFDEFLYFARNEVRRNSNSNGKHFYYRYNFLDSDSLDRWDRRDVKTRLNQNKLKAIIEFCRNTPTTIKPEERKAETTNNYPNKANAFDFEEKIGRKFKILGWDTEVTKKSGDQGVDVVIRRNGKTGVIQCKLYSGKVGNAAVQEIYTGKGFYKADFAAVVTNSEYSPSARELANSLHRVYLIHEEELVEFSELMMTL